MKKRTKLSLSEVETQMEVLTKEEMNALKGGIGDIIIDPSGIVAELKQTLMQRINTFQTLLSNASMTDETRGAFENTIREYQSALNEITQLEQSAEEYYISYGSEANTEYKNGAVYSTVPYGDRGLTGHELKHMHQYHTGEIVRGDESSTYDIQDEIGAYRRQDIINKGPEYFIFQLERTAEQIRSMIDEKGSQPYIHL
ncbi:hypothetical protein CAPN009_12660 [Capnocytophaga canimorsus]|nr:hypothetical protein CAPN009_12660 [Capnocytophaga canimorsus]